MKMIISDIHGNLTALKEVLKQGKNFNKICLGDVVGYAPFSHECIDAVIQNNITCIKGNHEKAILDKATLDTFNPFAYKALNWTKEHLTERDKLYIADLPYIVTEKDIIYTHGTPFSPETFCYMDNWFNIDKSFSFMIENNLKICFVGHTHIPEIIEFNKRDFSIKHLDSTDYSLDKNKYYLINVGSVGQSRNGIPRAFYALFNEKEYSISIKDIPYNIDSVAESIAENHLPDILAKRLYLGQ